MSNWRRVKISEVCELIVDCINKTAPRVEYQTPYRMIRTPNIKSGRVDRKDCRFVEKETYEKWTRRANVLMGDVLLTREAPMGQVGYVDFDDTVFLGQRIMQYRANPDLLDSRYLSYAFLSPDLQHQFRMHEGSGSVVSHIRVPDCLKFELDLPPILEQKKIAKILGDLDDKIELNRQTNQTLEHIAQAIFKSWFVDFEPTRAKIATRKQFIKDNPDVTEKDIRSATDKDSGSAGYAGAIACERAAMAAISGKTLEQLDQLSSEQQAELKQTAALFPDVLVESELGEIPEGWDASTLGKHFNVVMGQSPKGDTYNEERDGMLFFQGRRDFGFRYPTHRVYTTAPKRLAQAGDTLISVRAPVGDRNMADQECCLGRGVGGIRHKSGARGFTYAFIGHIEGTLSNSGSDGTVFNSINKNELCNVGFIAPNTDLLNYFEHKIESMDQRIEVNSNETEVLEGLRDSLLPKLLSGELKLGDVA